MTDETKKNGNGTVKTVLGWLTLAFTVVALFSTQAISADVRNRDRDDKLTRDLADTRTDFAVEIAHCQSEYRADFREVKTQLKYMEDNSRQVLDLVEKIAKKQGLE